MAWKRRSKSKVKNAKKSTYKGLDFKSNLELHCYKKLEAAKIYVKYEEETFIPATLLYYYPLTIAIVLTLILSLMLGIVSLLKNKRNG